MEMEQDLLGDLLVEVFKFLDSGFDQKLILHDETTQTNLLTTEFFKEQGGRWFMRSESIPGDLSIKSIGVDEDGLYIEIAPLDKKKVEETIEEKMLPFRFDSKTNTFYDVHKGDSLVQVSVVSKPETELDERCLCTILFSRVSGVRRRAIINLLDTLYGRSCFVIEDAGEAISMPTSQRQVQTLQLGLQQKLVAEQRPLLSLRTDLRITQRPELRQELRMLLAVEQKILSMKPEELMDFFVQYVSQHGEERTKSVLLFTLAGQVKRVMPKLSWKDSRRLARKMTLVNKSA